MRKERNDEARTLTSQMREPTISVIRFPSAFSQTMFETIDMYFKFQSESFLLNYYQIIIHKSFNYRKVQSDMFH
jgi:hypothetical protein